VPAAPRLEEVFENERAQVTLPTVLVFACWFEGVPHWMRCQGITHIAGSFMSVLCLMQSLSASWPLTLSV